jgi:hypothetical protein
VIIRNIKLKTSQRSEFGYIHALLLVSKAFNFVQGNGNYNFCVTKIPILKRMKGEQECVQKKKKGLLVRKNFL